MISSNSGSAVNVVNGSMTVGVTAVPHVDSFPNFALTLLDRAIVRILHDRRRLDGVAVVLFYVQLSGEAQGIPNLGSMIFLDFNAPGVTNPGPRTNRHLDGFVHSFNQDHVASIIRQNYLQRQSSNVA